MMLDGLRNIFIDALRYVPRMERAQLRTRWNAECKNVQEIKEEIARESMRPGKKIQEENERLKKQLDAAVKDIPRDCITCAFDDMGTEKTYHPCWDCSTEKSGWQWRGEEEKA